ncbi:MAG: prolyl aminopeptidase, partial [Actinobacteria bacterium]|nr:prolyl aminopeptidase [Actinomycetota bacterium]
MVQGRFPAIDPYDRGMLDVGDGQRLYWECCGNPDGKPAIYLHGGPGSGCTPGQRRFFDPNAYRVVLFAQRGSGRSRPLAGDPDADLSTNTTAHLVADI